MTLEQHSSKTHKALGSGGQGPTRAGALSFRKQLKALLDAGVHEGVTLLDAKHVRATNIAALAAGLMMLSWVPISIASGELLNSVFNVAVVLGYFCVIPINGRGHHFLAALLLLLAGHTALLGAVSLHGVESGASLFYVIMIFGPFLIFKRDHRGFAYGSSILAGLVFVLLTAYQELFPRMIVMVSLQHQQVINAALVVLGTLAIATVFIRTIEQNEDQLRKEKQQQESLNRALEREKHEQLRLNTVLTQEKAAQEALNAQLHAANEHKSRFLAGMSHELRTPLNAIIGFTRLVKRKGRKVLPERQLENLDKVLVSSNHLLTLINDVLDHAKLEAGQITTERRTVVLQSVLREAMETVSPLLRDHVELLEEIDETILPVTSDPQRIKQILLNLLSNAAKFTHKGHIKVVLKRCGDVEFELSVEDTGIGISEEALERIFDEFQQADSSTTRQYGGTGLGLSISRQLAQLLGGALTVKSTQGEGSTFSVVLPLR